MTNISLITALLCDAKGVKIPGTTVLRPRSGKLITSVMDAFPSVSVVFGADERANLALLSANLGWTLKFFRLGVGEIAWTLIEDPSLDILDSGDTITVTLRGVVDQLSRGTIGVAASFEAPLGSIVAQIGATGESEEWMPHYDTALPTAVIAFYSQLTPEGTYYYLPNGQPFPGNPFDPAIKSGAPVSPWTAVALDDSPPVLSAFSVQWNAVTSSYVTLDAGDVGKVTSAPNQYTDGALALTTIAQVTNASGNIVFDAGGFPLESPGAFAWTNNDVLHETWCGLGPLAANTTAGVSYGWWSIKSNVPASVDPVGAAYPIQNGAQMVGAPFAPYRPGDRLSVSVEYLNGQHTATVVYRINGSPYFYGTVTPTVPLRPMAFIVTPGGRINAPTLTNTVQPSQQVYAAQFAQATPLEALVQVTQSTGIHLRQSRDANGIAVQRMEAGTFGAQTGIRLTGGLAGDARRIRANKNLRLITAMNWKQETSKVINTVTPLGASTGDAQVTLDRLWRMLHDPTYENYGRAGDVPGSLFPEYDPANYPIKMTVTRNGTVDYWVRDVSAYAKIGFEVRGAYTDSQFSYATDASTAAQELTQRALYRATTAKLFLESQVNDTMTVSVASTFRAPQAGDRVLVDFRRIGGDVRGNFAVMTSAARQNLANPYLTMVTMNFADTGEITEDWSLSFLPRQLQANQPQGSSALAQLNQIKIIQNNSTCYYHVAAEGDVDSSPTIEHAVIASLRIPSEVFRITDAPLDVQLSPMRQQSTTAENPVQSFQIVIPTTNITISSPHGVHSVQTTDSTAFDAAKGLPTSSDPIADVPVHFHQIPVLGIGPSTPTASTDDITHTSHWMGAIAADGVFRPYVNNSGPGVIETNPTIFNRNTAPTAHIHHAPIKQTVGLDASTNSSGNLVGRFDATQITADLPPHKHPIPPNINDTFTPSVFGIAIDNGSGSFTDMTGTLVDTLSGTVGPWTSDAYIKIDPRYVNFPGKRVRIKAFSIGTDNDGIGHIKIEGQWKAEIGGLTSTVGFSG